MPRSRRSVPTIVVRLVARTRPPIRRRMVTDVQRIPLQPTEIKPVDPRFVASSVLLLSEKLFSAAENAGNLELCSTETMTPVQVFSGVMGHEQRPCISADEKWLVSGGQDPVVRVWNRNTGQCDQTLEAHSNLAFATAISEDGAWVVSGSRDDDVRVWNRETGQCYRTLKGHTRPVTAVATSADGLWIVSGSMDCQMKVWNRETGICVKTISMVDTYVMAVAISADGTVACGGDYGHVALWNRESDKHWIVKGHESWVNALKFSPSGRLFVSGSSDKTLRVWNARTGKCQEKLVGCTGRVTSVVISGDEKRVVCSTDDGKIYAWAI